LSGSTALRLLPITRVGTCGEYFMSGLDFGILACYCYCCCRCDGNVIRVRCCFDSISGLLVTLWVDPTMVVTAGYKDINLSLYDRIVETVVGDEYLHRWDPTTRQTGFVSPSIWLHKYTLGYTKPVCLVVGSQRCTAGCHILSHSLSLLPSSGATAASWE
jgi:hypothetical protein